MKNWYLLFLLFSASAFGQNFITNRFGGSIGLLFNIGTHQRSIGINAKIYYKDYFYQVNAGSTFTFNGLSYGNRCNFFENRTYAGAVLLAGKRGSIQDFELDGLNHQTNYNLGVSFNYLIYSDNVGTSQLSGAFGLHVKNFTLRFENDVFGGEANDRFRTGHILASYRTENFKFNSGIYIWTGETEGSPWYKIANEDCPHGFKIIEERPYGKTSHGAFYGGVLVNMPYGNSAFWKLGIDSEHIRNALQNRFTHDMIFVPKKWQHYTPHYPRLDENGCAVFEKSLVRKDRFFMQFGLNDNWGN